MGLRYAESLEMLSKALREGALGSTLEVWKVSAKLLNHLGDVRTLLLGCLYDTVLQKV